MALGKFSKKEAAELSKHASDTRSTFEVLQGLVEEEHSINNRKELLALRTRLSELAATLNESSSSAYDWVDTKRQEQQDLFDEKSEKWQEGDTGSNVQEWLSELEGLDEPGEVSDILLKVKETGDSVDDVKLDDSAFFPVDLVVELDLDEVEEFIDNLDELPTEAGG